MSDNDTLVKSLNNVLGLINNSFLLLKDIDLLLSEGGFMPVSGNTVGCEPSKNINQSLNQFGNFLPQYMSRVYVHSDNNLKGIDNKILCINIQFYHSNIPSLVPAIVSGVFISEKPEVVKKENIQHWWLKYAAYESYGMNFNPDGQRYRNKPFEDSSNEAVFWGRDILTIRSVEDIKQKITDPLIQEYYAS